MSSTSTATFRMGCSGSGDLITADELFEVLIMILPEADVIKSAFMKWISLSDEMKAAIETRLKHLTASGSVIPSSLKGAPGIQPGFTALPKRLEMDIAFMMKCIQEVLESVIRQQSEARHRFFTRLKACPKSTGTGKEDRTEKTRPDGKQNTRVMGDEAASVLCSSPRPRLSFSETAMSGGDHVALDVQQPNDFLNSHIFSSKATVTRVSKKSPASDDEELESSENDDNNDESDTGAETSDDVEDEFYPQDCDDCDPELVNYLRTATVPRAMEHSDSLDDDTDVDEDMLLNKGNNLQDTSNVED